MDFFDSNIEALNKKGRHFLTLNEQLSEIVLTYVGTDAEGLKWFWDQKERPVSIDSELDTSRLPDKNLYQVIFFFGIASFEEIIKVSEHAHRNTLFVIIEPNLSFLQHALNQDDFRKLESINYILAGIGPEDVPNLMKAITATRALLLLKNPVFYINSFYRKNDLQIVKKYIVEIRNSIKHKFFRLGNAIDDSLIGLAHNMKNLKKIPMTTDVAALKGCFTGYPAFVVSAGPSLDKNIEYLKNIENKGIIIAVDTIAEKLVNNGIKPHFIASVERINVWEYFFQNKPMYYDNSYLVAPPVLQPEAIDAFNGRAILPMRQSVREYKWLTGLLGLSLDHMIWMGASCAHVALGFASHIGASPLVIVGQDLAYGDDISKTHAAGTEYDIRPEEEPEEILSVVGYYDKEVKTQPIWNDFRLIFEDRIKDLDVRVINSTEGGARIHGTEQKPLREVVDEYCVRELDVSSVIRGIPHTTVDWPNIVEQMKAYVKNLDNYNNRSLKQLRKLEDIRDKWDFYVHKKGIEYIFKQLNKTEEYFQAIPHDELLYHNLQGPMVILLQKFHLIPEDGSLESIKSNLIVQIEFLEMFNNTVWLIEQVIQENFPWESNENGDGD
ncbi:motility associated factor glycosyltransferase family protein [Dendrosporobacter sp. 1207_IL3150]|uniref:motility associated factor glycosyltransferase family protein n=1 Tax=Dendrosporobacter sp. 1207_IL3150 TaxID=3084054 RepID=UPI002FDB6C67